MPVVEKASRFGFRHLGMPPLTQTLGPWVQAVEGSQYRRLTKIHDFTSSLISQIPTCDYFHQNAHYQLEDVLPFHWAGYDSQVRYTYVIEDLTNVDELWERLAGRPRRAIRKAEKKVAVHDTSDVNLFIDLYRKTFERQGIESPVDGETIHRVYEAAQRENAVRILVAEDGAGAIHGGVFLLHDYRTTYCLMGGTDPELRDSQALSLLLWEAIKYASTVSERFDFEGSMIQSVEGFFRSFGSTRKTYYAITKKSSRFEMAWQARNWLRKLPKFR